MSVVLSQLRWPSLAQDLAVMAVPDTPLRELKTIYATYGISEAELREILTIPAFQALFKQSLEYFRTQGSRAGSMYRAASLSQALSEKLFRDALNDNIEAKDSLKLLELLLRSAGQLDTAKEAATVSVQNNVGIQIAVPTLKNTKVHHITPVPEVAASV